MNGEVSAADTRRRGPHGDLAVRTHHCGPGLGSSTPTGTTWGGCRSGANDLVLTDAHDLEATLLRSPALAKVLLHHGDRDKVLSFESARGLSVREALLRLAAPLGRLRWFSREHGWDLVFRKTRRDKFVYLPYGDFIDERTWELDEGAMITTAKNFSERHRLDTAEVAARMQAAPPADPWQLCNGHDLCGILAVGLCRVLGSCRSAVKLSGDDVQDALLLAYEREHLAATEMFASLRQWEARRAPHRVL